MISPEPSEKRIPEKDIENESIGYNVYLKIRFQFTFEEYIVYHKMFDNLNNIALFRLKL